MVCPVTDFGMPPLLTFQVETEDARLATENVQELAVSGRRAGRVTVVGALALVFVLGKLRRERLVPNHLAVSSIEAKQMSHQVLLVSLGRFKSIARVGRYDDAISDGDGSRRSGAGELNFPSYVLRR